MEIYHADTHVRSFRWCLLNTLAVERKEDSGASVRSSMGLIFFVPLQKQRPDVNKLNFHTLTHWVALVGNWWWLSLVGKCVASLRDTTHKNSIVSHTQVSSVSSQTAHDQSTSNKHREEVTKYKYMNICTLYFQNRLITLVSRVI